LFNPAMSFRDSLGEYMPEINNRFCPARFVVIGAYDEIVNPNENINYFRVQDKSKCYQRVLVADWLEHQIDYNSFEEMVSWALKSYGLFLKKKGFS